MNNILIFIIDLFSMTLSWFVIVFVIHFVYKLLKKQKLTGKGVVRLLIFVAVFSMIATIARHSS